jgi:FtsH-binding integral membrane protein
MNTLLIQIFVALLFFICVIFGIANSAIRNKQFVCNRYILNTYLYIILTLNIIALQVLIMEYKNVSFNPNMLIYLGVFILTILCILGMHKISPKQIILKHIVWITFIILMGLMFYPMYTLYINQKGLIVSAILTTLILFLGLSAIAYLKPEYISLSWGPVLAMLLIGVIIIELLTLLFAGDNTSKIFKYTSYFVIGIFMLFILYDTKRLQINAKNCIIADYISESVKLFLDIWNIFIRLLSLGRR